MRFSRMLPRTLTTLSQQALAQGPRSGVAAQPALSAFGPRRVASPVRPEGVSRDLPALAGCWWFHVGVVRDEGAMGYGRFGVLSRVDLDRFFDLDDEDHRLIAARRRDYNRLGLRFSWRPCGIWACSFHWMFPRS